MKQAIRSLMVSVCLFLTHQAHAQEDDEYDFNTKNANHMKGAYFMCATKGFATKTCQKIQALCLKPPLVRYKCYGLFCTVTSVCLEPPNFFMNKKDVKKATRHAAKKAGVKDANKALNALDKLDPYISQQGNPKDEHIKQAQQGNLQAPPVDLTLYDVAPEHRQDVVPSKQEIEKVKAQIKANKKKIQEQIKKLEQSKEYKEALQKVKK